MERLTSWTIFTLRGVAVKVHISLLFLLFYVILVATASFPYVVELSGVHEPLVGTPLLWALIFSFSLIVSIFLHEFGHILVAQMHGFKVRQMTLMMLGGVSQMEAFYEKPETEFKVAFIGPLVSLAIAGVLFWIRSFSTIDENVSFYCFWVGQTNLALGIFNLLPAFPMDGGRILRSFLVTRLGRFKGTEVAVRVSHVFAWIFGIIGVLQFNLLLVLIAFFIYGASKGELLVLLGQVVLKGMKTRDLTTFIPAISGDSNLTQAVQEMANLGSLVLPVGDVGELPGVISSESITAIPREKWDQVLVKEVATKVPRAIDVNSELEDVWQLALMLPVRGIPITGQQRPVGIVKLADLVTAIELKQLMGIPSTSKINWWSLKENPSH